MTGKINWGLCILCQGNGTGLQCPYVVKNNKASIGSGYKTLAEQLTNFSELGHMLTLNNLMMAMALKQH